MDNQLLKYSAKDYFFKAALCQLCVDTLNAEQAIQKYEEMFPQFGDARESKLLKVNKALILCTVSTVLQFVQKDRSLSCNKNEQEVGDEKHDKHLQGN